MLHSKNSYYVIRKQGYLKDERIRTRDGTCFATFRISLFPAVMAFVGHRSPAFSARRNIYVKLEDVNQGRLGQIEREKRTREERYERMRERDRVCWKR